MDLFIRFLTTFFTVLSPGLNDAHSHAEDVTAQVAMMQSTQALEMYYADYGQYPGNPGEVQCFEPGSLLDEELIGLYLSEDYLNEPPSGVKNSIVTINGKTCNGSIAYIPIIARGIKKNSYLLAVNVNLVEDANFIANLISDPDSITTETTQEEVEEWISQITIDQLEEAEALDSGNTILVLTSL